MANATHTPHSEFRAQQAQRREAYDAQFWARHETRIRMAFSNFTVKQLREHAAEVAAIVKEYGSGSQLAVMYEKRAGFFEAMAQDRLAMEQDAAEAFKYSTRAETWLAAREYQDDAEAIGGEGKVVQGYLMMSSVLRALAKTKKRG